MLRPCSLYVTVVLILWLPFLTPQISKFAVKPHQLLLSLLQMDPLAMLSATLGEQCISVVCYGAYVI